MVNALLRNGFRCFFAPFFGPENRMGRANEGAAHRFAVLP